MNAVIVLVALLGAALSAVVQAWVVREVVRQLDGDGDRNTEARSLLVSFGIVLADAIAASGAVLGSRMSGAPFALLAAIQIVVLVQALAVPLVAMKLAYRLRGSVALGCAVLLIVGRAVAYSVAGLALAACAWIHPALAVVAASLVLVVTFLRWRTASQLARIAGEA